MNIVYKAVTGTFILALSLHIFATDIGVIPDTNCPQNSESISIYMDDEDDNNASKREGWVGATEGGTKFRFCRINGDNFKPLSNNEDYAVLKLSDSCPNNSIEFNRYFDNEDDRNANNFTGNIYPNIVNHNTNLKFCYFQGASYGMDSFPDIGVEYGVFAPENFSKSLESGTIYTDDEDDRNANELNIHGHTAILAIIHGEEDTTLNVHKVEAQGDLISCGYESGEYIKNGCWDEPDEKFGDYSINVVTSIRLKNNTSKTIRKGQRALRFEVRNGDEPFGCDPSINCGERAEVSYIRDENGKTFETAQSGTQFYAFSVMFDSDWENPKPDRHNDLWGHFFQLHGPNEDINGKDLNASAAISLNTMLTNNEPGISLILYTGDLSNPDYAENSFDLEGNNSLNKGNWIDFILKIKFSTSKTGAITIWRRDEGDNDFVEVLNKTGIATLQYHSNEETDGKHNWQQGFYRPQQQSPLTNVLWFDGMSRGTSFEMVKNASFPR